MKKNLKKIIRGLLNRSQNGLYKILGKNVLSASRFMQKQLAEFVGTQNFQSDYDALIKGMSKEDIATLSLMIARLQYSYWSGCRKIFTLTQEEHQRLDFIKTCFKPLRTSVGGGEIWCYGGYRLPKNSFEAGVFLDHHGIHKFKNLQKIREKNIIDVGGFLGDSALIFQNYTDKQIFCFEPMHENYQNILRTISLNDAHRITPVNKALGSKQEELEISCLGGGSSFVYHKRNSKKEKIEVITLDSCVQQHNLEVGLIKVDVEGFEMEFLKGALETIKAQRPAMILSIYHSVHDFFKIKPFIESLDLGYRFQIFKPIDHNVLIETCLLCECE